MKRISLKLWKAVLSCLSLTSVGVFCSAATALPVSQTEPLVGLWGAEVQLGVPVQGALTLDGRGGMWQARLGGYRVGVQARGGDFTFDLPGSAGEFREHFDRKTNAICGEWIQPEGVIQNNRYASPVMLQPVAASVWRGMVVPLEERFSVYASFQTSADGKLTAFLSNPEINFFRGRTFSVICDGSKVHLDAKGHKIEGTYDKQSDTLSLQLIDSLPPFQLSRRKGDDALGFNPRTPPEATYRYREPVTNGDGWQTASLSAEGLDETLIGRLIERVLVANPRDNSVDIQSLLIARHGHLVLEEYFYGFDGQRVHDMRSASKTFAPVLVGLAQEHGANLTPETRVYSLFPQYNIFANWDARKQVMTLRDLMTMTAGYACDDNDDNSPGNEDTMQNNPKQQDWYKYTLDLPILRAPGGKDAVYCSGAVNLVGGMVASATKMQLPEFFEQYLARPLQFGSYYLNLMPDGEAYMGGGAYLLPRDELKLGQLYLDGGTWNGKRILSKTWVDESTSFHSRFDPSVSLGQEHEYGYGWHINFLKSGDKVYRAFSAGGNGGQFVIVIPELSLVIGINGGSYGEFNRWYRWETELVPQFILPAVKSSTSH